MKLLNTNTIEIKKSKFIAYLYEIDELHEIKNILENTRSEHKKAKHVVYAYKFGSTAGKSAGTPLYNLLEMNNINNKLLIVVRYFGGVKLGAGPLLRAYKNAGVSVLN